MPLEAPPHRKHVRSLLAGFRGNRNEQQAVILFIIDCLIWICGLALVAAQTPILLKLLGSTMLFVGCARLFFLGHDACHGSFFKSSRLNQIVGHLALLPSLTPRQSWVAGHNIAHHGYNNLRGHDYVWAPLSPDEYMRLPRFARFKERLFRRGWAPGAYYLAQIWWKKLIFPSRSEIGSSKPEFIRHSIFVLCFSAMWLVGLVAAAAAVGDSIWLNIMLGFALPFLLWNTLIGFVVYVHHTHPSTKWYAKKVEWSQDQAYLTSTVHLTFPFPFSALLHNIMEHTAHHVDLAVPFHNLKAAQQALSAALPGRIITQKFSWSWYASTARICQLYDYSTHRWIPFSEARESNA